MTRAAQRLVGACEKMHGAWGMAHGVTACRPGEDYEWYTTGRERYLLHGMRLRYFACMSLQDRRRETRTRVAEVGQG
jgi:hypothetical protein